MLSSWDGRERRSYIGHPEHLNTPLDYAREALARVQEAPYVGHTSTAGEFIPLYGPIRNGIAYLQDGDYGSAGKSAVEAGLDTLSIIPGGEAVGIAAKALGRGEKLLPLLRTARAATDALYDAEVARRGIDEVHHVWRLNGMSRNIPALRNHPAFLMVLPKEEHKLLHGSWVVDGVRRPKYGLLKRAQVGTPPLMKTVAAGTAAEASRALPPNERDER